MAQVQVYNKNEVSFGDMLFPIAGDVKFTNITVTPNPTLYGAGDKKGDTQVMSEFIQDSNTGGRGIYKNDARTDTDRYYSSSCGTRFKQNLTLAAETVDMGKPAALTTENLNLTWSYRNEQYFAFANHVYRWVEATLSWSVLEVDLTTVPTQAIVFNGTLYVAYGSGYATRSSGGTWTNFAGTPATYFAIWDAKLYRLGSAAGLWTMYYLPVGGAWSGAVGTIPEDVTPYGLTAYRDSTSALVIYAYTNAGLWAYDATNTRFLQTEIRFPPTSDPITATVYHDGKLYMSSGGLGALAIQAGSQFIASPTGLDLEDGVPEVQNGKIVNMVAAYNEVIVLTDATKANAAHLVDSGMGNPFEPHHWTSRSGEMTLWAYDGSWHQLWTSATPQPGTALDVSSAYGKLRTYWSASGHALYQELQATTLNPRSNPNVNSAPSGSHIASWYSFGIQTQLKIHGHLVVRTSGCSATETVQVYYGTDLDDNTWTLAETITTDGQHVIKLGGPEGLSGYYFRYRFDLARGADKTKKPIVEFWSAEWMRVLPATYGYVFTVDLTHEYGGKTPAEMLSRLQTLADQKQTPELQLFSYQDQLDDTTKTHYARITRLSGDTYTGADQRSSSIVQVSLVVPYQEDSISGG